MIVLHEVDLMPNGRRKGGLIEAFEEEAALVSENPRLEYQQPLD
jgi:hypothetical protein